MGLDSPTIIHWGPPEDLEMYVQETGCGDCDNMLMQSSTTIRDITANIHASEEVKRYCENMSRCRAFQFTDEALDLPLHCHLCCDVCASVCL